MTMKVLLYYVKVCGWIEVKKPNKAASLETVLLANEEMSFSKGLLLREICFPVLERSAFHKKKQVLQRSTSQVETSL
jgi:hypothetical protein